MQRYERQFDVADMSEALEVSRSGYYRWREAKPSSRRRQDEVIKGHIKTVCHRANGHYGHRPVHAHLREMGVACGRDRTLRLMHEMKLVGRVPKVYKPLGTNSKHLFGYHPNLLGKWGRLQHRDQVWVADTTGLRCRRTASGWCCLATVMDLCTRLVVGWSVSSRNDAALVSAALKNAAITRGHVRQGIMHHSDRGSTYASDEYQRMLARLGMRPSMSGKGNCYDNAAMESFFGRYKTGAVKDRVFDHEDQVRTHAFNYIEVFYNRYRKHASLGYLSPMQAEEKILPLAGGNELSDCLAGN